MLLWSYFFSINKKKSNEANIISLYFAVNEDANCDALEKAYQYVLKSNDALRLRMERHGMTYRQYIADYEKTPVERIILNSRKEFTEFLKTLPEYHIPLCSENPIWVRLVEFGSGAALVFRIHHMCYDGYSNTLLFKQLKTAYNAYKSGTQPDSLEIGSIEKFFEFSENYKNGPEYNRDLKFWKKEFSHQRNYKLPARRRAFNGIMSKKIIKIDNELFMPMWDYCKINNISFVQLIMTLTSLVVYQMSSADNFALSSLTHGRRTDELRNTIGCMMNTYPVFYDIDTSLTIGDYVKKQRSRYFKYMLHGQFPLSMQTPLSYFEAIKNKFNFNHYWILFSYLDYASAADKPEYEMSVVHSPFLAQQFYCSVVTYDNMKAELVLRYQNRVFSENEVDKYISSFFNIVNLFLHEKQMIIRSLRD